MLKFQFNRNEEQPDLNDSKSPTFKSVKSIDIESLEIEHGNFINFHALNSKIKALEMKIEILEPQYPIASSKHSIAVNKIEHVKEVIMKSLLLTSGHGLIFMFDFNAFEPMVCCETNKRL